MKGNVRIARELVRLAKLLIAGNESFGRYSIDIDKGNRAVTVYFILGDDAVESDAEKDAKACRNEIKQILDGEGIADVTSLRNNDHKSFCFDIMLAEDGKTAGTTARRVLVAVGADEGGDSNAGSDATDSGDIGSESDGDSADGDFKLDEDSGDNEDEEKQESNPEDERILNEIKEKIQAVCKKHAWDAEK